ncbi:MAG: hypothetical protein E6J97_09090 [Methanobacteriota archaeon]|nr:MAG: hypothetical protein E6J97_09090 [Euryarchaeota archaeon]
MALGEADFLRAARAIVDAAQAQGTSLRILGSLGIYAHSLHVPESISVLHRVGRISEGTPLFTDLDLMGYASQGRSISRVFESLGFKPDDMINGFFGDRRLVYYEAQNRFHVDIFLDRLEFSHDVLFGKKPSNGRLELDSPTISLTDMVLEKLQIHRIGRKDLVDLAKSRQLLGNFVAEGKVPADFAERIESRIGKLEAALQSVPKGRAWQKRAKVGTAKPWFREVEEIVR